MSGTGGWRPTVRGMARYPGSTPAEQRSQIETQIGAQAAGFACPAPLRRGSISGMLPDLRYLDRDEWHLLRDARLTALRESPHAFLATHEEEGGAGRDRWLSEFDRGEWIIGEIGGETACQMGVTREFGRPAVRHLEYVWVAPAYRRSRVAFHMLSAVLGNLTQSSVHTVFLWVLDGNDAAKWLYKRLDFTDADERQEYPDPSRVWVRLKLDLARAPAAASPAVLSPGALSR